MSIVDRISKLEEEVSLKEAREITAKEQKNIGWTGKFKSMFSKKQKNLQDKVIVVCLNSKKHIEEPVLLPIISGGIIVYKDRGFRFDPSGLYTIKLRNNITNVLLIEEDDRLPVGSNERVRYKQIKPGDIEELKKQGRYTRNDPILLKMLWNAQIEKTQKKTDGKVILWVVLAVIAVIVIYMFMK